jgi:choline dehydrogenase-like flavoprotein
MIDARTLVDGEKFVADVCIVGAGPAGVTLAHELIGSGLSVILAESGGPKKDPAADALSGGDAISPAYAPLTLYRRRILGGASTIWGGRCVPYDAIDFEPRPGADLPGWPLDYAEVQRYYAAATRYAEAGEPEYLADDALPGAPPFIEGFASERVLTNSYERFSRPSNFWKVYGAAIEAASNIRVFTYATCTRLAAQSPSGGHVEAADFVTLAGNRLSISAKTFVVAAGGLETYRLLALSDDVQKEGLGNSSDMLGRCLMSHIEGSFARLRLSPADRSIEWGFATSRDGVYGRRRLQLAQAEQRRNGLLNLIVRLHHASPVDPSHGDAVLSTMFLAKHFILAEYRRKITMVERDAAAAMPKGWRFWGGHLRNIVLGAPGLASFLSDWIVKRHFRPRAIPYVALPSRAGVYPLDVNAEQIPNRECRLWLGMTTDRFGLRLPRLDWKMTDVDVRSIAASLRLLRDEFAQSGVGAIVFNDATLEKDIVVKAVPIGGHHIGMARMSADPRYGVVDSDLRLHDVDNVFLASGAVLPTSSHANPTLTILALTLRLAERLKRGSNAA